MYEASKDVKDNNLPQVAFQLLGWDTVLHWENADPEDPAYEVNFPGLCEVPEISLPAKCNTSDNHTSLELPVNKSISVSRQVITLEELHVEYPSSSPSRNTSGNLSFSVQESACKQIR